MPSWQSATSFFCCGHKKKSCLRDSTLGIPQLKCSSPQVFTQLTPFFPHGWNVLPLRSSHSWLHSPTPPHTHTHNISIHLQYCIYIHFSCLLVLECSCLWMGPHPSAHVSKPIAAGLLVTMGCSEAICNWVGEGGNGDSCLWAACVMQGVVMFPVNTQQGNYTLKPYSFLAKKPLWEFPNSHHPLH